SAPAALGPRPADVRAGSGDLSRLRGRDSPARTRQHGYGHRSERLTVALRRTGSGAGRHAILAAVLSVVALGAIGCQALTASSAPPPSPVDGIVVAVSATGLTAVQGFTLRPTTGGANLVFTLGPLENATQFAPGH